MIQIDMPMPDNCLECRFNTSEFGYCNAMPVEFVGQVSDCEEDGKPKWCPLKAQEPRLLTLEEVVGNIVLGRDVMLWFEFNDSIKELNAKDIEYNDYLCDDDMPTLYEPNLKWRDNGYRDGVIVAEYNDVFRCWTSRPDKKRMEEILWE